MTDAELTPLGSVAEIIRGVSYGKGEAQDHSADGLTPILRAGNIQDELELAHDLVWVPSSRVSREQYLRDGDIAMCASSGSADVVGKSALFRGSWCGSIGAFCMIVRPDPQKCDPGFLAGFMRSRSFRAWTRRAEGINIKNIRKSELEAFKLPLPPLFEQRRIVDLLSHANSIRRLRREAQEKARQMIPALFVEMFGDRVLENGFPIQPLGEVADVVSGVTKGRRFNGEEPIEVPYLRVANVQADRLDLSEIKTIQALRSDVQRLKLMKGDVLLTEGGDYDKLGRGALLEVDLPDCIHQNHVFRVRVHRTQLYERFFTAYLQTAEAKSYFLRCAKRTTNLASINMTQLRQLPVPLPPLSLQHAFVDHATDLQSIISQQDRMAAASEQMVDALMAKVF